MPREIQKHELMIDAFRRVDIVSELVDQLPNGEFKNELDMDIILFGRSYRGKKVGPYCRLLEFQPGEVIVKEDTWESSIFYILVAGTLEASITEPDGNRLKVGEVPQGNSFGEMALLSGTPRTATVTVGSRGRALVLEFTRPAIRLLRKLPKFGVALDRNYRNYGLGLTLNELKEFNANDPDPAILKRLDDSSRFAIYEKDHVLFREGDPINRVMFVRSGWIQRVSGVDGNPRAAEALLASDAGVGLDFLGAGTCLGLDAVDKPGSWPFTATVWGRAEVLEIAVSRLREDAEMNAAIVPFLKTSSGNESRAPERPADDRVLFAATREIETGVVDAVNLLVMDMAKCVRCGNCSLACHKVHGHSRLIRRGIHIERPKKPLAAKVQSVLVPTVCMHCQDPECLTGCPTGAIARFPSGEIDIEPTTCIGCGDCATQCPYNAISMIARPGSTGNGNGHSVSASIASAFAITEAKIPPPVEQTENLLAVKCNLCKDTGLNPPGAKRAAYSCEENCPTGALVRVNPREYFDEVGQTLGLIQQNRTHAIGVNIHKSDPWARAWHAIGILLAIAAAGAAIWATNRFTQDTALMPDSWITVRWLTGLTGLASIVWVMLYPMRKQVYRRRAGALRYWMLSHIYLGVVAGALLLVHGGTNSGGLLTTFLMISFDLVIASGLFGAACYVIVPRFMTRIEGEPLLIEDLEARREELRADLVKTTGETSNEQLRDLIQRKVRRRFLGLGYLLRQFLKKEDLASMLADAREEFRADAAGMSRSDDARLMSAVENAATLRRVDALCYLHQSLKLWLPPHVLFTSIMLVLMVIHIVQVVYFNVR
jgi:Fe-S-cluster-containing dehydrogenase component/CRP-like cAMP-binding protein